MGVEGEVEGSDLARFPSRIRSIFACCFLLRDHGVLGVLSMPEFVEKSIAGAVTVKNTK